LQFRKQDFYALRDKLHAAGKLFEDPEFPASDKTLFSIHRNNKNYKWLRPKNIHKDPQFFVEGFSRFDVDQGELGDCWLLAATASLTSNTNLFPKVVCDDNSFTDKYAGIFHFR
jgi:calpain, invertebrate